MAAQATVLAICVLICCGAARASFGTSFAVSFPATRSDSNDGYCKMYIHADTNTIVTDGLTITTGNSVDTFTLYPNETRTFNVDPSVFRTSKGIEFKGIYVESTVDVSVILSNAGSGAIMDTALALPINNGSNNYMVMSHASSADEWICSTGSTMSFYTVTAYEDETTFMVYSKGGGELLETVTLRRFQTYTNRTVKDAVDEQLQMNELTGYIIESDKPISVTAGNPCTDIDPLKSSGPIWSSIPATQNAGYAFVSHILEYPDANLNPYLLRTISLEDGNSVNMAEADVTMPLNAGDYFDLMVENNRETEYITCSKPCMVAQHSIQFDTTAIFMVILPPMDNYMTDVFFTVPDLSGASVSSFLSLIYYTNDPYGSGLFFDGVDLSGEFWLVHPRGYSFLELPITDAVQETVHRLTSEDPTKTFSALIHGQGAIGQGYGYIAGAILNTSIVVPDKNETIPEVDYTYRISMNGDFVSSDGADFGPECTIEYSIEMQSQAETMLTVVNDLIGIDLCPSLSKDVVSLQTVATSLTTEANQGSTFLQYDMLASLGEFGPPDFEACAASVETFLATHSNWGDPLLPTAPGCPGVVFTSPQFNDSGSEWICPAARQHHLRELSARKNAVRMGTMVFTIVHTGNYFSENEEDIPPACLADYNSQFIQKTTDQVAAVNAMISSRELCAAREADNLQLVLDSVILSGTSGSGLSYQEYGLDYDPGTSSADLYSCGSEASAYLTDHSNWDQPMLPPVPDCPTLAFVPEEFTEYQLGWECVEAKK